MKEGRKEKVMLLRQGMRKRVLRKARAWELGEANRKEKRRKEKRGEDQRSNSSPGLCSEDGDKLILAEMV